LIPGFSPPSGVNEKKPPNSFPGHNICPQGKKSI
jgi:hypothetical protein